MQFFDFGRAFHAKLYFYWLGCRDKMTTKEKIFTGHIDIPHSMVEMVDGRIASTGRDGLVKIWEVETMKEELSLVAHTKPVLCIIQLRNANLATASNDNSVGFWRISDGKQVGGLIGHGDSVRSVCERKNGGYIT